MESIDETVLKPGICKLVLFTRTRPSPSLTCPAKTAVLFLVTIQTVTDFLCRNEFRISLGITYLFHLEAYSVICLKIHS